jgi:taurine dioxygenase
MFTVTPLDGQFGAKIESVDASRLEDSELRQLIDLLYRHRILVFPKQNLSKQELVRFSERWGKPTEYTDGGRAEPDFPTIFLLRNTPEFRPPGMRNDAAHWHTDGTFQAVPQSTTMLYGIEAPTVGGETLFVDAVAAYEALPADEKAKLEKLRVIHKFFGGKPLPGEFIPRAIQDTHDTKWPKVLHPLVMPHPVASTKALYGLGGTPIGIDGMDQEEADELLLKLKLHVINSPFRHQYKVRPGDLMLWDNFSTMHSATALEYTKEDGKRRLIHRISVRGFPTVLSRSEIHSLYAS